MEEYYPFLKKTLNRGHDQACAEKVKKLSSSVQEA
jgi:hypothetical protein